MLLSVTVFLPMLGALLIWALPVRHARWVNLVANLFVLVQTLLILDSVSGTSGFRLVEKDSTKSWCAYERKCARDVASTEPFVSPTTSMVCSCVRLECASLADSRQVE